MISQVPYSSGFKSKNNCLFSASGSVTRGDENDPGNSAVTEYVQFMQVSAVFL